MLLVSIRVLLFVSYIHVDIQTDEGDGDQTTYCRQFKPVRERTDEKIKQEKQSES